MGTVYDRDASEAVHRLFRRCVECPNDSPACPTCNASESCVLIPQSCNACASTQCQSVGNLPGQIQTKSSTPVGAIVGGVIVGLTIVAITIYLVWRFVLTPRKRKDTWNPPEKRDQNSLARGGSREHSIASTVLTRASNVIQIAYIPGVTGRSPLISPAEVPPMPILTPGSTPQPDTHFFMPNDLRDSTWSNGSENRISLTPSLARASANTTLHRSEPPVTTAIPVQQVLRAQLNLVNVKPSTANTNTTRPSPLGPNAAIGNSSIVARNVTARPIEVKRHGPAVRVPTLGNLARANSAANSAKYSETGSEVNPAELYDEKDVALSPTSDVSDPLASPDLVQTTTRLQTMRSHDGTSAASISALSGPSSPTSAFDHKENTKNTGLAALIEDAIKNASAGGSASTATATTVSAPTRSSPRPSATRVNSGPFSDIHELSSSP